MSLNPEKLRNPAYYLGVGLQVIGWILVLYGFLVAWTSSFDITPFRYEGF